MSEPSWTLDRGGLELILREHLGGGSPRQAGREPLRRLLALLR